METIHFEITKIIERSRREEESFLLDSDKAAIDIIDYLKKEKVIKSQAVIIKMRQTKIKTEVI